MKSRIIVLVLCCLPGLGAAAQEPHRAAEASLRPAGSSEEILQLPAAPVGEVTWAMRPAIPRKTLSCLAQDLPAWGFNSRRYVSRRKEESAWRPALRQWGHLARCRVTQHGKNHGSRDLAAGDRLLLTPSILGRDHDKDRGPPSKDGETSGQVGGISLGEVSTTTDPANHVVAASNFVGKPRPNFSGVRPRKGTYPAVSLGLIALNKNSADPPVHGGEQMTGQRPAGHPLVRFPLPGVQRGVGNCEKSRR